MMIVDMIMIIILIVEMIMIIIMMIKITSSNTGTEKLLQQKDTCRCLLPDPGVSGVRSMGPGVSIYVHTSGSFVKLC